MRHKKQSRHAPGHKIKWLQSVQRTFQMLEPEAKLPNRQLLERYYNQGFDVDTAVTKCIEALELPPPIKWEPVTPNRGGTEIHAYRIDKGYEGALCKRRPFSGWKDAPGAMVDCDRCMSWLVKLRAVRFEERHQVDEDVPEPLANTLAYAHWLEDGGA